MTTVQSHNKNRLKKLLGYVLAVLMTGLVVFLALGVGFGEWGLPWYMDEVSWQLRYPRILTALLVGMALAVSGSALQAVFENPLFYILIFPKFLLFQDA